MATKTECEICGIQGIVTGAYGDTYRIRIRTIEVESAAYAGDFYSYIVCDDCESEVR